MTGDPLVQPHDFDENPEHVAQVLDFRKDFEREFEHVRFDSPQLLLTIHASKFASLSEPISWL